MGGGKRGGGNQDSQGGRNWENGRSGAWEAEIISGPVYPQLAWDANPLMVYPQNMIFPRLPQQIGSLPVDKCKDGSLSSCMCSDTLMFVHPLGH